MKEIALLPFCDEWRNEKKKEIKNEKEEKAFDKPSIIELRGRQANPFIFLQSTGERKKCNINA